MGAFHPLAFFNLCNLFKTADVLVCMVLLVVFWRDQCSAYGIGMLF